MRDGKSGEMRRLFQGGFVMSIYIALGSNLGDKEKNLKEALQFLEKKESLSAGFQILLRRNLTV